MMLEFLATVIARKQFNDVCRTYWRSLWFLCEGNRKILSDMFGIWRNIPLT